MPEPVVALGVDMGTTGCRACLVAQARSALASATVPYEPDRPRPGWAEQDPDVWWQAFCEAVRRVLSIAGARRPAALALSSQSTALVPVDKAGRPLRKAIIWQDARCAPQCEAIARRFGAERVRAVTGWPPSTFLLWPKVLWFMEAEPDLMRRCRLLLQAGGYVVHRLCGRAITPRADAVGLPMDLRTLSWHGEFCDWRGFPSDKVPAVAASDSVVGRLLPEAAACCGLPAGLPVVAGGMDTACAALSVGAFRPGRAFEVSGTSGGIGVVSREPSANPLLGVAPHLPAGLFINHAPMSAAGASLSWCREVLCGGAPYEALEREVEALGDGPTGLFFLPYMAGERAPVWDPHARGAFVGLTLATRRAEVVKAVMEGVAYALRQNIDVVEQGGPAVTDLRSCGGGSRSDAWCQIKADVTGRRLMVFGAERDAAFGAALLAGIGAGLWTLDDVDGALERCSPSVYAPRGAAAARYARLQPAYNRLYARVRDLLPAPAARPPQRGRDPRGG